MVGAAFYRVGWIADDAVSHAFAENSDLFNHYVFADITGATSYTATGLQPGKLYYFTVASLSERFGESGQADVLSLILNNDGASCPAVITPPEGDPMPIPETPEGGDYDADNDGLIEIRGIAQLDAIRHDLGGDGAADGPDNAADYIRAFPGAAEGMGCPDAGCTGYELAANLDFGTAISGSGWEPIGHWNSSDDYAEFNAVFDGNGHTISNLYIARNNAHRVGLFGRTGVDSDIRRVGLASVHVTGSSIVGGLVGDNQGSVSESYVTGAVIGARGVGGLVGSHHAGVISDSYAASSVSGTGHAGGLVGFMSNNPNITRGYATGNVTTTWGNAGGLVGHVYDGIITASYATGSVFSRTHAGGLVGFNNGAITASYSTGNASSVGFEGGRWLAEGRPGYVGGLAGINASNGSITASYATGSVYSAAGWCSDFWANRGNRCFSSQYHHYNYAGGLVGQNAGSIGASYATGAVTGGGRSQLGGLAGSSGGTVNTSYWDTETSGRFNSAGGVGLTTTDLQTPTGATGIYAVWNPSWWDFGTAEQYPVLKVQGLSVAAQRQ